jgi:D-glycero-alpha-D-manno-heptose 1-phosphate guanylyltransferase
MRAVILAGGEGLRLRNVVKNAPKPMARIAGRPFLEYLILQLIRWNIKEIVLSIGYKGGMIKSYFGNGKKWDVEILYSEEIIPLGTGGALKKASSFIDSDRFVVMNGDSFFDADLTKLIEIQNKRNAIATIALTSVENKSRYGSVDVNNDHVVLRFIEKDTGGYGFINGGIYLFQRNVIDMIRDGNVSLEKEVLPLLVGKGLYALTMKGAFVDIGTPDDYLNLYDKPEMLLEAIKS